MHDEFGLPEIEEARDLNQVAADQPVPVIDEVEVAPDVVESPPPRPPGPGLPESLLWTAGVFFALIGAGIVWMLLSFVVHGFNPMGDVQAFLDGLSVNSRIMFLLPPNLLAFLVLIPLGLWRMGRYRLRKLNLAPPSLTQLVIVLAAVFPTTFISTPMFSIADAVWAEICEGNRFLEAFNEQTSIMNTMEQMKNGSLVLLLFFLAVVPAVGEEFMFRGLVGRGLVARWGVWWGILMTSCLFALLHMYPPHVAAVLPIGIMMHVVYLTTRSFWAPVLFHFCNNAMAATYLALGLETDEEMSIWMPLAALAFLAACVVLLYRFRTRYLNEDGEEIGPDYVTVSAPPPDVAARRFAPVGWITAPLFAVILAATAYYLVYDAVQSMNQDPEAVDAEKTTDTGLPARYAAAGVTLRHSLNDSSSSHDGQINA